MAGEPGYFQFEITKGATNVSQAGWALVNEDGDILAVSPLSLGVKRAEEVVQWIKDNASKCRTVEVPAH